MASSTCTIWDFYWICDCCGQWRKGMPADESRDKPICGLCVAYGARDCDRIIQYICVPNSGEKPQE